MSHPLELNCLVLGEDPSCIFPIEVDGSKTVGMLKELIRDRKRAVFDHATAGSYNPNIFGVSFPVDNDLGTTLKCFQTKDDPDNGVNHLLNPTKRLKGVFRDPTDEHIHVIVQPPPVGECQPLWLLSVTHCGIISYLLHY